MGRLHAIAGDSGPGGRGGYTQCLAQAIQAAKALGFVAGVQVLIGSVEGRVVGHNIARSGRYAGYSYPVVVMTDLGVVKCSLEELRLARR